MKTVNQTNITCSINTGGPIILRGFIIVNKQELTSSVKFLSKISNRHITKHNHKLIGKEQQKEFEFFLEANKITNTESLCVLGFNA